MTRRRAMMGLAAADQLHEAQAGVKMGYDQPSFDAASTRWVSTPIPIGKEDFSIEYYGNTFGASLAGLCTLFNADQPENYAPGCLMAYPNPLGSNGIMAVIFEGGGLVTNFYAEPQQPFHLVLTRSGRTMTAYINNVVKDTIEQAAVADFADFRMGLANSSLIIHTRIFNHALSASEVTALYNAGKPEKWVLPTAIKDMSPVQITSGSSYTWTGEASAYYGIAITSRPFTEGQTYKIKVTVSDFMSGAPFMLLGTSALDQMITVPPEDGTYEIYGTFHGGFVLGVLFYGGMSGTDRRLTLTIDSIEPVGCIAEWLPQNVQRSTAVDSVAKNLTGTRSYTWTGADDPTYYAVIPYSPGGMLHAWYKINVTVSEYQSGDPFIFAGDAYGVPAANGTYDIVVRITDANYLSYIPIYGGSPGTDRRLTLTVNSISPMSNIAVAWLDSAKQLPLGGDYLPPLRGSLGGYDMAANGTPEIILKPIT